MSRRWRIPGVAFAIALAAAHLTVADGAVPFKPQMAPPGISYVSGGIGEAQQKAMKDSMQGYNLRLTFARPKCGDYLSDVKVRSDQEGKGSGNGNVLDVTSTGPMPFVRLPDGAYRVRAQFGEPSQTKTVNIMHEEPTEVVYYFPEK